MRVFTVHQAPTGAAGRTELVPEGFSVWGALFGPGWLLVHGAWSFAALTAIALFMLPWMAWPGIALLIGLCGQDARRVALGWRGWKMHGVVLGSDREQAELRWLDRRQVPIEGAAP